MFNLFSTVNIIMVIKKEVKDQTQKYTLPLFSCLEGFLNEE